MLRLILLATYFAFTAHAVNHGLGEGGSGSHPARLQSAKDYIGLSATRAAMKRTNASSGWFKASMMDDLNANSHLTKDSSVADVLDRFFTLRGKYGSAATVGEAFGEYVKHLGLPETTLAGFREGKELRLKKERMTRINQRKRERTRRYKVSSTSAANASSSSRLNNDGTPAAGPKWNASNARRKERNTQSRDERMRLFRAEHEAVDGLDFSLSPQEYILKATPVRERYASRNQYGKLFRNMMDNMNISDEWKKGYVNARKLNTKLRNKVNSQGGSYDSGEDAPVLRKIQKQVLLPPENIWRFQGGHAASPDDSAISSGQS